MSYGAAASEDQILRCLQDRCSDAHYAGIELTVTDDMAGPVDRGECGFEFLPTLAKTGLTRFVRTGFIDALQLGSRKKRENRLFSPSASTSLRREVLPR